MSKVYATKAEKDAIRSKDFGNQAVREQKQGKEHLEKLQDEHNQKDIEKPFKDASKKDPKLSETPKTDTSPPKPIE